MTDQYYENELRYLHEEGKRFAKKHPERARFLNIGSLKDRDPYVERLFEGFAFLCARINKRLDDSFPELSTQLVNCLWPQFLQQIPSLCIMQFRPRGGMLQKTHLIKKGTEILSDVNDKRPVVCRFMTTQDVHVNPITLSSVRADQDACGKGRLTLDFRTDPAVMTDFLHLFPIRIYLHGSLTSSIQLRELLMEHVAEARLTAQGTDEALDPNTFIRQANLSEQESLLPPVNSTSHHFSLLRDLFAYPEKFLFVDLFGSNNTDLTRSLPQNFSIHMRFDSPIKTASEISKENFKLHCSPAVNLFCKDTEPIVNNGSRSEHLVIPDSRDTSHYSIFDLISVTGTDCKSGKRHDYRRYNEFTSCPQSSQRYFTTRQSDDAGGERRVYLALKGNQTRNGRIIEENLHIEAWQTNGFTPRDRIGEDEITLPAKDFPDFITFSNITRPTSPVTLNQSGHSQWIFISHLNSTLSNLRTAEHLKRFLNNFNIAQDTSVKTKIDSVERVKLQGTERALGGAVIRGLEMRIGIKESGFQSRGEIHLFGTVLGESLAGMVSINSFLRLTMELIPSGQLFTWDWREGTRWTI
ncbi:MAG: type VI secretion system baseplate subunit TssF [Fibrobacterota bacterium]